MKARPETSGGREKLGVISLLNRSTALKSLGILKVTYNDKRKLEAEKEVTARCYLKVPVHRRKAPRCEKVGSHCTPKLIHTWTVLLPVLLPVLVLVLALVLVAFARCKDRVAPSARILTLLARLASCSLLLRVSSLLLY